jgi:hypothetical protein
LQAFYFLPIIFLILVVFITKRKRKIIIAKKVNKKRIAEENLKMVEFAKKFINKECLIYPFEGNQIVGTIKEVNDSAILVEKADSLEAVNLDYVIRIREYPVNKNGKKKSIIID